MVVCTGLPRITPAKPISRISRATVERAIGKPSRIICRAQNLVGLPQLTDLALQRLYLVGNLGRDARALAAVDLASSPTHAVSAERSRSSPQSTLLPPSGMKNRARDRSPSARSRTSGTNLFVVLLIQAPPSQELEPPANPARFT